FMEIDGQDAKRTQQRPRHLVPVEEGNAEQSRLDAVVERHPEQRHERHRQKQINGMEFPPLRFLRFVYVHGALKGMRCRVCLHWNLKSRMEMKEWKDWWSLPPSDLMGRQRHQAAQPFVPPSCFVGPAARFSNLLHPRKEQPGPQPLEKQKGDRGPPFLSRPGRARFTSWCN